MTEDNNQVIILQLVSKTGSDRYLAFGIREQDDHDDDDDERASSAASASSRMIAGDVVVGWINAKSGKGGLDDYFLATTTPGNGRYACEDGAESCPDTSKPVRNNGTN